MDDKRLLLDHIDEIHTTEMGLDRIKRNLKLDTMDVCLLYTSPSPRD